jgi:hypothetical protein
MDGETALINCILESGVVLTKTSPKFGQWRDPRAKSVFGLGFSTESELEQASSLSQLPCDIACMADMLGTSLTSAAMYYLHGYCLHGRLTL